MAASRNVPAPGGKRCEGVAARTGLTHDDISEKTEIMKLTPVMERFILHWGEMGWRWGINRSVAQVHALLMLSPKPLPADEISETLDVARSNVSTSLKE